MRRLIIVFVSSVLALACTAGFAATIHVPADQPTIQAGINAAVNGDTVLVADGTYTGTGNREIAFHYKLVTVKSQNGPLSAIIDCQNLGRGFHITDNEDSTACIDGFTIRNGDGSTSGGAIAIVGGASPIVSNCIIENCSATNGGGIYIFGAISQWVRNCIFRNNSATQGGGGIYLSATTCFIDSCAINGNLVFPNDLNDLVIGGGGIYADSTARLSVTNSIISNNAAEEGNATHDVEVFGGGGIHALCDSVKINETTISNNSIHSESNQNSFGGGMLLKGNYCTIDQCVVDSNSATHFYNTAAGAGIYVAAEYVSITRCEIKWNKTEWNGIAGEAGAYGGAVWAEAESLLIRNCDFVDNECLCSGIYGGSSAGGGIYANGASYTIDSSLFQENKAIANVPTSYSHTAGDAEGGAVHLLGNGIFKKNVVINNLCAVAVGTGVTCRGASSGGGLWGSATVEGCTFYGNVCDAQTMGGDNYEEVSSFGGGIFGNCTIIGTIIDSCIVMATAYTAIPRIDGGGVMTDNAESIECSDLWNNVPNNVNGDWNPEDGQNIIADPLFCPDSGSYYIYDYSPCAPENNACSTLIGAFGVGCNGIPSVNGFGVEGETLTNLITHPPMFSWEYYCPVGNPEDSFEIAVGTNPDWSHAEMWNPEPFAGPDTFVTYAGLPLVDGATYYLRLRVHNGLSWSEWYNTLFRMNSVPTMPVHQSPAANEVISTTNPTLWLVNSTDAESDPLVYDFRVFDDSEYVVASADGIALQTDSTGWTVDVPLGENRWYRWCARAYDGYEYSDWTAVTSFYINSAEEFPSPFYVYFPPDTDNAQVYDKPVTFWWGASFDPDPGDSVRYKLLVAIDAGFVFVATYDSIYTTQYPVGDLGYSTHYWWKVQAIDTKGNMTTSINTADFWTWVLGDANHDRLVNVGDAVFLVTYIFRGGYAPFPLKSGDVNADCKVNIGDAVYLINYVFRGGPPPQVGCAK